MDKKSILKLLEQFKTQDSTENGLETLPLIMEWEFDDLADALVKLCALDAVIDSKDIPPPPIPPRGRVVKGGSGTID
jgi:hypothetical protein